MTSAIRGGSLVEGAEASSVVEAPIDWQRELDNAISRASMWIGRAVEVCGTLALSLSEIRGCSSSPIYARLQEVVDSYDPEFAQAMLRVSEAFNRVSADLQATFKTSMGNLYVHNAIWPSRVALLKQQLPYAQKLDALDKAVAELNDSTEREALEGKLEMVRTSFDAACAALRAITGTPLKREALTALKASRDRANEVIGDATFKTDVVGLPEIEDDSCSDSGISSWDSSVPD